ncbi:MAG: hypothetical protein IT423_11240 [Pirellulaceae bacterium]|nr:hypothetical protein [Pirellulaceae bacterium]
MQRASAWQPWLRNGLCAIGVLSLLSGGVTTQASAADTGTAAADQLQKAASWKWPEVALIEQHLLSYLDQVQASPELRERVLEQWKLSSADIKGPALLERVLSAASIIEPRISELVAKLNDPAGEPVLVKQLTWLTSDVPGWLQDAVRLACGRALAQRRLYDEALETLTGLAVDQICDPASLVFYRAVCQHHLLQKKECLANVDLLLERQTELPVRFTQVAQLMSADIKPLKNDSLDEIARMMNDVQRRLDLGRAGTRVREEEKEIVDKLDKMIEQIEQQLQQQQQQQQQANGQNQKQQQGNSQPMQDTQLAGGPPGAGDVDQKNIGKRDGWGNLPPAERQASLQRMTQELPSHYREVIEGYFRQLAKEKK